MIMQAEFFVSCKTHFEHHYSGIFNKGLQHSFYGELGKNSVYHLILNKVRPNIISI